MLRCRAILDDVGGRAMHCNARALSFEALVSYVCFQSSFVISNAYLLYTIHFSYSHCM